MSKAGLYDPRDERGSCGIGFVADIEGRRSSNLPSQALEGLARMAHRGAVAADGRTGDGAGMLTQLPYLLLRRELEARGVTGVDDDDLALGVLFLPEDHLEKSEGLVEAAIARSGLALLAWREVPVERDVLGVIARRSCPAIRQVILQRPAGLSDLDFDRHLLLARRRLVHSARHAGLDELSVPSFSRRTVVYKGLLRSTDLATFYPDLTDRDFTTAIAVFHLRFSTNTEPVWSRAQPLRLLAHNGEINTLQGNVNWMAARERELYGAFGAEEIPEVLPVIQEGGSDSAMLDNVLEFLALYGRDPLHALRMLIPQADHPEMDPDLRAFYEYHATLMEPWDGPAAVVMTDGRYAGAVLDRNGLRPLRYWRTRGGLLILASETGLVDVPTEEIESKGRLGPGQMLAVDTVAGRLLGEAELGERFAGRRPYRRWVERRRVTPPEGGAVGTPLGDAELLRLQRAFDYHREDLERLLDPMAKTASPPVGSMGDDTPLAALASQPRLLYDFFQQRFAQVTNPPIDPLRERSAMTLRTPAGAWGRVTEEGEDSPRLVDFRSPVISQHEFQWLLSLEDPAFAAATLDATFPPAEEDLEAAVRRLTETAENAADGGATFLVLSDRGVGPGRAAVPMLLATSAVHQHLVKVRKRMQLSLVCDTGEAREDHHVACLIGYGGTLVHPWLAIASVAARAGSDREKACRRYLRALEQGLLKIMAKLGVSPVSSYLGAQLFEILGLDRGLVERWFTGSRSVLGGIGLAELGRRVTAVHRQAFGASDESLPDRGLYRFRRQGESHAHQPRVVQSLHRAVRHGDSEAWRRYSSLIDERAPSRLRDLLEWRRAATPQPHDAVEGADAILSRFTTAAMSHGALSREAHESMAVAMNRLGGRSNSGEGGEDPRRFYPYRDDPEDPGFAPWRPRRGDLGASAIKQVASGRFGVTPEYLATAREIEIKMAQGSKPGEGGQIPGHKVSAEIARLRHAVPGVALVSPPPHHDIYSIEDLAQLIHDLKRINPTARIAVKLVSLPGIGTIAAGVAKAWADTIHISGGDGGTGASPLGSIRHAGLPWELGLAETQQVLVRSGLRERVSLRVDGGLQTARDVVIGALLGAEEFSFGTAALVALGCIMARQCHLDTCPVGIATQKVKLRRRFPGTPEHVETLMRFLAEDVRRHLAELGAARLDEIVGRSDFLAVREAELAASGSGLDLAPLLYLEDPAGHRPRRRRLARNDPETPEASLDEILWQDARGVLASRRRKVLSYRITHRERSVGARLAGEIARASRGAGLARARVDVTFHGAAGQSFGAFLERGMRFVLRGEAQDYVGKGMHGGELVLVPPPGARFASHEAVIAGNTLLYGATGGSLFAAGRVGERFAVRNSGATAVVEGCGDHGCEYMTGGTVVVLGGAGRNFAAGMSAGEAWIWDEAGDFACRVHGQSAAAQRAEGRHLEELRRLLVRHLELTHSVRARWILDRWAEAAPLFWKVTPRTGLRTAPAPIDRAALRVAAPGEAA